MVRMTSEQDAYVRQFLNGTGLYSRLIVQDRSIPSPFFPAEVSPRTDADRLLLAYIRESVRPEVAVEAVRDAPPAVDMGYPGNSSYVPEKIKFPAGLGIVALNYRLGPRISGTPDSEWHPFIAFYGDPVCTGGGRVRLSEPAPGDLLLPPRRPTGEEIFASVRGRLDLILRNVLR